MIFPMAPPPCCFANEAAQIYRHPLGFVQHVWLPGAHASAVLRAAFEALLGQLHPVGAGKVLIDQRRFVTPSAPDTSWFLLDWLPRAVQQGYRYGAVLSAGPALDRVSRHTTRQEAMRQYPIIYHRFDQESLAIAWLLAQP
ncbi:hypothetical protein [Hymenobacter sp. GOD-10R]|uniref:hypothetical protein n=1 Tax=Hymenobacter sp. GOD-10R TaxID=3093922 RepID=UPI002D78046F|nr:hypothetical protein [Hymenobacter sp. GOD-10R]WRQ31842.1 hypothetical protein SD425_29295 [Hymenobacter sp. GOD-10R]